MTAPRMALVNQRTDEALADRIELAVTRNDRRKGLLGRDVFETSSEYRSSHSCSATVTGRKILLQRRHLPHH